MRLLGTGSETMPLPPVAARSGVGGRGAPRFILGCTVLLVAGPVVLIIAFFVGSAVLRSILDESDPVEVARVVSRPLVPADLAQSFPSDAEALLAKSRREAAAEAISWRGGDAGRIADEYLAALSDLEAIRASVPSIKPFLSQGVETLDASQRDDGRAFLQGLVGMSAEFDKYSTHLKAIDAVHARIVACRLQAWDLALARTTPSAVEVDSPAIEGQFIRPAWLTSDNDTLRLRNTSGIALSGVLVHVVLIGRGRERFTNLYFVDEWPDGESMLAVCNDGPRERETVEQVAMVEFRVLSSEIVTEPARIKIPPSLW